MSDNGLALARTLYPRVSTILKEMNLSGYGDYENANIEWGKARGHAVHMAIKLLEEDRLDPLTLHPDVAGPVRAYQSFKGDTGYKAEAWEEAVYHDGLRFRGTLDSRGCLAQSSFQGIGSEGPAILDFKCSKQPDLTGAAYQLAAYALAKARMLWGECLAPNNYLEYQDLPPRYVIQLGDEGYRIHDVTNPKAVTIFEAAVTVWHAQRDGLTGG